ncbi:hypothetical protein Goshw_018191, partial [Gossypium schwendimanii]|nr:hypothetical protein [Gossypium schwendimanii]
TTIVFKVSRSHLNQGSVATPILDNKFLFFKKWFRQLGDSAEDLRDESEKLVLREVFTSVEDSGSLSGYIRTYVFVRFSSPCSHREMYPPELNSDPYMGIPLLVQNFKTKWWDKFNDENFDFKYLDDFFKKNPRLCKSVAPDQTTSMFLQAKSNVSTLLTLAKTKKEYKKLMAEVLHSIDFDSENEKSSTS